MENGERKMDREKGKGIRKISTSILQSLNPSVFQFPSI
jgi:hypothetical protein